MDTTGSGSIRECPQKPAPIAFLGGTLTVQISCCIDKRSSAELSEAINSMFRYYQNAAMCYAYFADVRIHADMDKTYDELSRARWFTRGWTLQELLAPRQIVLFASNWARIGTRFDYQSRLSQITRIEVEYLCGTSPLSAASISKRMSWAARRNTSRLEDAAYCLMGIFDVNMPLLYGEGKKAFRRLQEEIMKANPTDHTLFAWGRFVSHLSDRVDDPLQLQGLRPIQWDASKAADPLRGLFADSPADFWYSADLRPCRGTSVFYSLLTRDRAARMAYPTTAGAGVELELPVIPQTEAWACHWPNPKLVQLRHLRFALLLCETPRSIGPMVLVPLFPWGNDRYGRRNEPIEFPDPPGIEKCLWMRQYLKVEPRRHRDPQPGDFLIRLWGNTRSYEYSWRGYGREVTVTMNEGIVSAPSLPAAMGVVGDHLWVVCFRLNPADNMFGFGIFFLREKPPHEQPRQGSGRPLPMVGPVAVYLVPLLLDESTTEAATTSKGFTWVHKSNAEISRACFRRTMAFPEGLWKLNVDPFPRVEVRVTRIEIGPLPADIIDLVDITVT